MYKKIYLLKKIYSILFILLIIINCLLFFTIGKKASNLIIDYANFNARKLAIDVLRNSGLNDLNEIIKNEKLYDIIKNDNGEIENIEFNTVVLNDSLVLVAKNVKERLSELQNGINIPIEMKDELFDNKTKKGIIYGVPLGITTKNAFFMNIGPKIPVKIEYVGDVGLDVKTKVEPYGINSALVSAYLYVEVIQKAIMPFKTKEIKVTSEIPVIITIVKGVTPNYIMSNNIGG